MRRPVSFLLAVFLLIVLCSCELSYQAPAVRKMHILVYGNDYRYGAYSPVDGLYYSSVRFEDGTLYSGKAKSLSCTVADATEIGKTFSALAEKAGLEYTITYLTGSQHTNLASFKTAIGNIAADSNDNDITILYFSCHGHYLGIKGKKIPYGTDTTDNTFIAFRQDTNSDENVLFPISKTVSLFDSIKGVKLVIGDFCYSGSLVQAGNVSITSGEYTLLDPATLLFKYRDEIRESSSMFCLSAARYNEESWEDKTVGHGFFTSALLKALGWDEENQCLKTAEAEKDNRITLSEIAKYVIAHDGEAKQTPMVSGGSNDIVLFSF